MASIEKYFLFPAALPVMPELVSRLMRSLSRDDLSLNQLADLIGRDQSLALKVLRLANSVRYSPRQEVSGLREAAMLVGLNGLRDLALAACMGGLFPKQLAFDRVRFWRHAVATAGYSRFLANVGGLDPDSAYLGGLILRTGRILMLQAAPEEAAATEKAAIAPDTLMALEQQALGCNHAEISAGVAERWNFPEELRLALAAASDPLAAQPFSPLGGVLRLASTLADAGERELPELDTLVALHGPLLEKLGLTAEALVDELVSFDVLTIGVDQLLD
jgi:HD-like signal output (HDOD) protein